VLAPSRRPRASWPLPDRGRVVAGIAGAHPRRTPTTVLTTVLAWPRLLLLAALLAPAVFVDLPLPVGNRRVRVAGLYGVALLVALSPRTGVWLALVAPVVTGLRDNYPHRSQRHDAEPC